MTTIAVKNGVIAADSRMTAGLTLKSDNYKKIEDLTNKQATILGKKALAYALAGTVSSKLILERVLEEGLDVLSTLETEDDFQAVVMTQDTTYIVNKEEKEQVFSIIEIPDGVHYAMGSGATVANYILNKGGDPVDAVAAACTTDLGSGGDIHRWERPDEE